MKDIRLLFLYSVLTMYVFCNPSRVQAFDSFSAFSTKRDYGFLKPAVFDEDQGLKATDNLVMDLTRVRLFVTSEQIEKAITLINNIKNKHKVEDGSIAITESEIYAHTGHWQKALVLINEAIDIEPDNITFKDRKKQLLEEHSSFVSFDREVELSGNAMQQFAKANGEYRFNSASLLGIDFENNKVRTQNINRTNGIVSDFEGDRQRAEIYYKRDYPISGNLAKLSLFVDNENLGVGLSYEWLDLRGKTTLSLNVNKPDWQYIESIVDSGTKHNIEISRIQRIAPRTTVSAKASYNIYNINGDHNAASGVAIGGTATYLLKPYNSINRFFGNNAVFSLNYILDAEYAISKDKSLNTLGNVYNPYPLTSRENHTFNIDVTRNVNNKLSYELYGGYTIDRLGGNGFIGGAMIDYKITDRLKIGAKVSRQINSRLEGKHTDIIGANIKYLF